MSKTIYEVSTVVGSYTKDGEKKNRYLRIGSVIETKLGPMLKIDCMPVTDEHWPGWCYLNTPKPKEGQAPAESKPKDADMDW